MASMISRPSLRVSTAPLPEAMLTNGSVSLAGGVKGCNRRLMATLLHSSAPSQMVLLVRRPAQRPSKFGSRFSTNAVMASTVSLVVNW